MKTQMSILSKFKPNICCHGIEDIHVKYNSTLLYSSVSEIVGCPRQGGYDVMLEGAPITPGNRYTYKIFIDNGLIYSERGT